MPMYDRRCNQCGRTRIDQLEKMNMPAYPCVECGGDMERVWTTSAPGVVPDEIPGGYLVKNGLCNEDGTPRRYYSKSEMVAEAKRRGLTNYVTHVGSPGSDKNKHTSRWI